MRSPKSVGRIIGILLLLQFTGGLLVNFVFMEPVFAAPGFLSNAAGHPLLISVSVLLGLATGLTSLAVAITGYQLFRQYSQAMALWFIALALAGFTLNAVENINLMSMLSLSEAYAKANGADQVLFQALRGVVAASRNWAHYIGLLGGGSALLIFYSLLFRFALVPRMLAACGMGAVALQMIAVAMPLFGQGINFLLLLPLAVMQLIVTLWLLAKGLAGSEQARKARSEA
jgi:hypothetical protein